MRFPWMLWLTLALVTGCGSQREGARRNSIPSFTRPVATGASAEALGAFVDENRGKLVHINVNATPEVSRYDGDDIFFATEACEEGKPEFECSGFRLHVRDAASQDDHALYYYHGDNWLSGYFVIDENVEMHQGMIFGLQSVPASQVALRR